VNISSTVLETSYLWPDPVFALEALALVVLLLVWPLIDAIRSRRFLWALLIVLLAPLGGLAWWIWRFARRSAGAHT
jgi:hypothetical protein